MSGVSRSRSQAFVPVPSADQMESFRSLYFPYARLIGRMCRPCSTSGAVASHLLHKVCTTRARARCLRRRLRRPHQGQRSHDIVAQGAAGPHQPRAPRRVRLRGEHRRRRRHPDPDAGRVPAHGRCRSRCRPPARYGAGLVFLPHDERDRDAIKALIARHRRGRRAALLGWRDVPTDNRLVGDSAARRSRSSSRCSSARGLDARSGREPRAGFERKLYVIRKRVEHAVDALKINALSRRSFYIVSLSAQHADLQGHAARRSSSRPMFPDLADERSAVGARARAPALQHQHVPVVAAGAPLPADRAQRRDQHAARQHQLDARARGPAPERRCSATT